MGNSMDLNETNDLLRQILQWQKLQGFQSFRGLLPDVLGSKKKRQVFELTNGRAGVSEISKMAGVAGGTISNWWQSWYNFGILEKKGRQYIKIVSLKDISPGKPIKK